MSSGIVEQQSYLTWFDFGIYLDELSTYSQFRYPIIGIVLYLITIAVFQPSKDEEKKYVSQLKSEKKSSGLTKMKLFLVLHNSILCIFSLLCFLNTYPEIYEIFSNYGWKNAICLQKLTNAYDLSHPFGFWCYLFYLSKYYEFIDTWIVIARHRRPIILQIYHHMGAVLGMWMMVTSRCNGGYLFVVLNSFIHTIMYFYYVIASLGYQISFKNIITMMQIGQFIIGSSVGGMQIFLFGECMTYFDIISVLCNEVYVIILIYMFYKFYKSTYNNKSKSH